MPSTSSRSPTDRLAQALLMGSTLALCWLGMQVVHEFGHVAGAWMTGGAVAQVELHPLRISLTDVAPNPWPLLVVWAGPLGGVLIPVVAWIIVAACRFSTAYLFRFFAGFCLVANGCYLGCGAFVPVGDAADLIRIASSRWPLALFGLLTVPAGFALWHSLGPSFGLGQARQSVSRRDTGVVLVLLAIVIAAELLCA